MERKLLRRAQAAMVPLETLDEPPRPVDAARVIGYARFFPARDTVPGSSLSPSAGFARYPATARLHCTRDKLFRREAFAQRGRTRRLTSWLVSPESIFQPTRASASTFHIFTALARRRLRKFAKE